MNGIYRTRVGYTGGKKKNPTYYELGNHTEALQVDFDPFQISFETIVNMFWQSHNPVGSRRSSQYMSAIWYSDDQQQSVINASIEVLIQRFETEPTTQVQPLDVFYLAEDYHQKYGLQRHQSAMSKFKAMYSDFWDFVDSTAAARLNGFSYGQGTKSQFDEESESYGFSASELKAIYEG